MVFHWSLSDSKSPQVTRHPSQYSARSQQFCSLDDLYSPNSLQILRSFIIIIIIIILLWSFSHQCQLMVFHWKSPQVSDSKSPQVSRTRLRILAVLSCYFTLLRVFDTNVSWRSWVTANLLKSLELFSVFRSITGVWVTASLLTSLGLFSVFWPF